VVWLYAELSSSYAGNPHYLLIVLVIAVTTTAISALSIYRMNLVRITRLRANIIAELLEFSRIWVDEAHQRQIAADCVPKGAMKPATLAVAVPVFGTLDILVKDLRKWRLRRS
jgi:hypothetical protein